MKEDERETFYLAATMLAMAAVLLVLVETLDMLNDNALPGHDSAARPAPPKAIRVSPAAPPSPIRSDAPCWAVPPHSRNERAGNQECQPSWELKPVERFTM